MGPNTPIIHIYSVNYPILLIKIGGMGLHKISEIERNNHGEIIKVILEDGRKLNMKELFEIVEQENIGGAFIDVDAIGNKHLHIINDGDTGNDLDCLSLI